MLKKHPAPKKAASRTFEDTEKAVGYIQKIYDENTAYLRKSFMALAGGADIHGKVSACYPYASINVPPENLRRREIDMKSSYGFVSKEGLHSTTLTRPDLFSDYYKEMLGKLMENHLVPVKVGVSECPIPVLFAFPDGIPVEVDLDEKKLRKFEEVFDPIDLGNLDGGIVDGEEIGKNIKGEPLALYTAPRVDFSLQRLSHYTGTSPSHFQNFVLFTNYQFYVDEFRRLAHEIMKKSDELSEERGCRSPYTSFVEPGNHIFYNQNVSEIAETGKSTRRILQMPAYHLTRADGNGITLVNIGVGPSNAKNITDHIAVLRPHAWIMMGHCGGLKAEMKSGDYVLAHGYDRKDLILDKKLDPSTPIPVLAEIQLALQQAVHNVMGDTEDQDILRTGTVVTVADRNWELDGQKKSLAAFKSRPIAVDMESGTVAANGFRHRVPYGTLLCVSDRPLHGAPKMPGSSEKFYRARVAQHIRIGKETCELLCETPERLHSRKLQSSFEPAFL